MTPTQRAFKHGILKAQMGPLHPLVDNPYRDPKLKREFQRGVEFVRVPKPSILPRREPTA